MLRGMGGCWGPSPAWPDPEFGSSSAPLQGWDAGRGQEAGLGQEAEHLRARESQQLPAGFLPSQAVSEEWPQDP